jgi:hypothetical protein
MEEEDYIWQDREIRFDEKYKLLDVRRGEVEIDSINSVEDTKGNNGLKGCLSVTNLRLIWCSHKDPRTNLSIGFNCVIQIKIRTASSRLRGNTQGAEIEPRATRCARGRDDMLHVVACGYIGGCVLRSPSLILPPQDSS